MPVRFHPWACQCGTDQLTGSQSVQVWIHLVWMSVYLLIQCQREDILEQPVLVSQTCWPNSASWLYKPPQLRDPAPTVPIVFYIVMSLLNLIVLVWNVSAFLGLYKPALQWMKILRFTKSNRISVSCWLAGVFSIFHLFPSILPRLSTLHSEIGQSSLQWLQWALLLLLTLRQMISLPMCFMPHWISVFIDQNIWLFMSLGFDLRVADTVCLRLVAKGFSSKLQTHLSIWTLKPEGRLSSFGASFSES